MKYLPVGVRLMVADLIVLFAGICLCSFTFLSEHIYAIEECDSRVTRFEKEIEAQSQDGPHQKTLAALQGGLADIAKTHSPGGLTRARVSSDTGEVDVSDAILILRRIVGLITEFPVESH